jgi:hypothetical protein
MRTDGPFSAHVFQTSKTYKSSTPGAVGEKRHDLSLDGNAVLVDLVVEGLTEHDEVLWA